ncbi:hypothetical protein FRACA_1360004 [Frankia canadensis]|uniref:Uncharacterized protein n=1 Tax=Frankia canadensis TaxID=1836972 RepID=A0A2I2KL01_9ACTN|nr:hypothetical protein FRACA_1360004 [Frankia canadensis]SOU53616.1 hypothetical protein FRACA_1360004 [Frankia canadensis]
MTPAVGACLGAPTRPAGADRSVSVPTGARDADPVARMSPIGVHTGRTADGCPTGAEEP